MMDLAVETVATLRATLLTAGRPALRRASGLGSAVGIVAAIVFGGNGLRVADLVHLFHASWRARAALWSCWILLATPAVAPAFDAPGTPTLRALRVPRGALLLSLMLIFVCIESPWGLLFACGGGPSQAATQTALAITIQTALVTSRKRPRALWYGVPAIALAVWDAPSIAASVPACALAIASVRAGWMWGLERNRAALRITRPMPVIPALTIAYLLRLVRAEGARLSLVVLGAVAGSALLATSLRHDPTGRPVPRGALVMALPLTLAAAVLAGPVLEVERRLRPWLRSLRVRAGAVVCAFVLAVATPSSALAAGAGIVAATAGGASVLTLGSGLAIVSLVITATVTAWARVHDRMRKKNPIVFVVGVVAIASAAVGASAVWGESSP